MQRFLRVLIPVAVLVLGWLGYSRLSVEKAEEKRPMPKGRILKTRVVELRPQDFQTIVRTQGVVRAHNEASLTAEVSGKVKSISPSLQDGAFFFQDEVLLEIHDEDFKTDVLAAEANLARTKAAFSQEEARANQARLNWEDLGYTEEPNELVLRLPQLREAEANVKAAAAGLERANRDLERTIVRAPFAGRVLQRSAVIGQSVTPATALAMIYNTAIAEVRLPIAARDLAFLQLPERSDQPPLEVTLSDALNVESTAAWTAQIVGTEGALDENSRELFAIAHVVDPFSRQSTSGEIYPPLRIGQPVRAEITGRVLKDVLVVPRLAVRQLNRIYLVDRKESTLQRREIEPIWSGPDSLVIRDPEIPEGALLATSRLVYAPNTSRVEILPDEDPVAETETETGSKPETETETGP